MPINYAPSDLVMAYGATMTSAAASQFAKLVEAAARDGVAISASSSYRSYSAQVATYNHWVTVNSSVQAADKVSARPGYSEHQTGLAVDVTSNGCALDWLCLNCCLSLDESACARVRLCGALSIGKRRHHWL